MRQDFLRVLYLLFLFILLYLKKKEIDYTKKESIFKEINKEIEKIRREDTKHVKNPAAFKYLRYRVKRSIELYFLNNSNSFKLSFKFIYIFFIFFFIFKKL